MSFGARAAVPRACWPRPTWAFLSQSGQRRGVMARQGMERLQVALIVLVIVAVAAIAATAFLATTGPVGPVAGPVDQAPSTGDVQRAQERLSQGARLSVAAPLASVGAPG